MHARDADERMAVVEAAEGALVLRLARVVELLDDAAAQLVDDGRVSTPG